MFRRRWSGLPADPDYPSDLKQLGYFINEDDQIRSIENPKARFNYYAKKNMRWNDRRAFAFDEAVSTIIYNRLCELDLTPLRLPLGAPLSSPHVRILSTPMLETASHVVVIIGSTSRPLGVLSQYALNNFGIDYGSLVPLVRTLLVPAASSDSDSLSKPGVVLANPGELWWWPEGKRSLTQTDRHRIPRASAVHESREHDELLNTVPGNRTEAEHVRYVFEEVVAPEVGGRKKVHVIALGDAVGLVEAYLDDDKVWEQGGGKLGGLLSSLVILGGYFDASGIKSEYLRRFLKERARAYITSQRPLDTLLAGPRGNPALTTYHGFGCPVYSAGDQCPMEEMMALEAMPAYVKWIEKVARDGDSYLNEEWEVVGQDKTSPAEYARLQERFEEDLKSREELGSWGGSS
ncbi:hypothetical protein QBC47DRAFT_294533 [Echria macrotheca]|uniref:Arb2 domain-containing protein n=1 Tax=Echria macrotheca TaxID=438768 RepID=A0AAJ0BIA0_9PEZI|nr:hypothetical protein QBC47DRAFT_294533 [Echria macrotheca]